MVRLFSPPPSLSRAARARRRLFFSPEALESRQLLSVAAFPSHAVLPPVTNVPALIAPVTASQSQTAGSLASSVNSPLEIQIILQVNPVTVGGSAGHTFTETIFIVGEPFVTGPISGTLAPTTGAANPSDGASASASGNAASTTSATSNTSITPLALSIVAGPAGVNRAPIIIVVAPQPLVANLAPSNIAPVTTQAVMTAVLEEQPLSPPQLGQGFESPVGQGTLMEPETILRGPSILRPPIATEWPATDYIEPFMPAPEDAVPVQPALPVDPTTTGSDVPPPGETILLAPVGLSEPETRTSLPVLVPRLELSTQEVAPAWSMATMIGTAAVATGGYQLLLGGSNRFNQRWLPTRGSSTRPRSRKARAST